MPRALALCAKQRLSLFAHNSEGDMRRIELLTCALALLLPADCARQYLAAKPAAADDTHHHWSHSPSSDASRVALNESSFAWVVQTGRGSAVEAVAALMLTFLQRAANQTGFVADVNSTGQVKLADTGHAIEQWSLARWEEAWPPKGLGTSAEPDTDNSSANDLKADLSLEHAYFPHGAHKVLPGFKLMYAKWPTADWYIMVDDDTFIFRRALMRLLSSLDPEEKHYIGYPRHGAHMCRDPTAHFHKEPQAPFALGGCGMILSKAAMKQLEPNIAGCIVASQDCYLDDVRLSFCLRDIGIRLNTTLYYPAMNFAPNSNIDWARIEPCVQPVVFHGVTPMEMHMLHAADMKTHGHATMADIFAEMSNWGVHSGRAGIRYSDRHMKANSTDVVDQRDCRMLCEQDAECKGWSFANEGGFCELVTSIASSEEDWRFTGGISQPAYVCQSAIS